MAPRTVLITGCSAGGIGSALVESFEKSGLYVFATGRSISKMSHLEQLHNVDLLSLDVTSTSSISAAVEAVTAKTGGTLDYLVNNAGIGYFLPTLDVNIDEAKKMFDINVWGALAVIKMFAPLVIAAKGTIVNISSVAGQLYPVWENVYAASKAAITTIGESLRLEMTPFGVKVVTVVTGEIKTNFFTNTLEYKLLSNSVYMPIEKGVAASARGEGIAGQTNAETYADKVVADVLGGANGKIYRGKTASMVRFISTFLPTFSLDMMLSGDKGLDTLTKAIQARKI